MIAAATGEKSRVSYADLRAAHEKPLFEILKDLPRTEIEAQVLVGGLLTASKAHASLSLSNKGPNLARLIQVKARWDGAPARARCIELFSDNYIDLLPGESKTIDLDAFLKHDQTGLKRDQTGPISGNLLIEGPNISSKRVRVEFKPGPVTSM